MFKLMVYSQQAQIATVLLQESMASCGHVLKNQVSSEKKKLSWFCEIIRLLFCKKKTESVLLKLPNQFCKARNRVISVKNRLGCAKKTQVGFWNSYHPLIFQQMACHSTVPLPTSVCYLCNLHLATFPCPSQVYMIGCTSLMFQMVTYTGSIY